MAQSQRVEVGDSRRTASSKRMRYERRWERHNVEISENCLSIISCLLSFLFVCLSTHFYHIRTWQRRNFLLSIRNIHSRNSRTPLRWFRLTSREYFVIIFLLILSPSSTLFISGKMCQKRKKKVSRSFSSLSSSLVFVSNSESSASA